MQKRTALKIVAMSLVQIVVSTNIGLSQELPNTPADPYGLSMVGLGTRLKVYPVVVPTVSEAPQPIPHQNCGEGASYRIFDMPTRGTPKRIKIVVLTFQPDAVKDSHWAGKDYPQKPPNLEYIPPVGYGSVSFGWPAQLRTPQFVRLQWTGKNDKGQIIRKRVEFHAEIDLREGDTPSISWKLDSYITPTRTPMIVGKRIEADPVLFYVTITKEAKKCISKGK